MNRNKYNFMFFPTNTHSRKVRNYKILICKPLYYDKPEKVRVSEKTYHVSWEIMSLKDLIAIHHILILNTKDDNCRT